MKKLFIICLLVLVACTPASPQDNELKINYGGISTYHDDAKNVTCWVYANYNQGGLSCIPDWMLVDPNKDVK